MPLLASLPTAEVNESITHCSFDVVGMLPLIGRPTYATTAMIIIICIFEKSTKI